MSLKSNQDIPTAGRRAPTSTTVCHVVVTLIGDETHDADLLEGLKALQQDWQRPLGCLGGFVWRDARTPNSFIVVTHWRSESLWHAYHDDPIAQRMWATLQKYLTSPMDSRIFVEPSAASD